MSEIRATEQVSKKWGWEQVVVNRAEYCGKILHLNQGGFCSMHAHLRKLEDFFVLSGRVWLETQQGFWMPDEQYQPQIKAVEGSPIVGRMLRPGDVVNIGRGMLHRFTGVDRDSALMEISTQHFDDDSYRLTESGQLGMDALKEKISGVV